MAETIEAELAEMIDEFDLLGDWEERYRHVIDLGKHLAPLSDAERNEDNRVRGCASQVWLVRDAAMGGRLHWRGDSDAHIVRGLVCLVLSIYSNRPADEIAHTEAMDVFQQLGLTAHLTPQRSNGVRSMVERIKNDARQSLQDA